MLTPVDISSRRTLQRALILDEKALIALVREIIDRSGMTVPQVAGKLGINPHSLWQYYYGYRRNPSLQWMIRLAGICGGKVLVELP